MPMTVDQMNYVYNKYGGKDNFINSLKSIYIDFNNLTTVLPVGEKVTLEKKKEYVEFDDSNEIIIVHDKGVPSVELNNYTPMDVDLIVPYACIQAINVFTGKTDVSKL